MKNIKQTLIKCAASGVYTGNLPLVPGTFGSLWGVLLFLLYTYFSVSILFTIGSIVLFTLFSIYIADEAEKIYNEKDPRVIVIDEIAGMWITLLGIPITWKWLLVGFVLFRVIDVLKPFPIKKFEDLKGGWGIVLDDVAGGLMACGILHLMMLIF